MKNKYAHVRLPSWVTSASKEALIAHIQYLTSTLATERKALSKARYRYRKAENKLKQIEEDAKNETKV